MSATKMEIFLEPEHTRGLVRKRAWMVRSNDPEAVELFGTDTLPTAFLEGTPAEQVTAVLQRLNPDATINVTEA